jgi:hypothetical protein
MAMVVMMATMVIDAAVSMAMMGRMARDAPAMPAHQNAATKLAAHSLHSPAIAISAIAIAIAIAFFFFFFSSSSSSSSSDLFFFFCFFCFCCFFFFFRSVLLLLACSSKLISTYTIIPATAE